MTTADEIDIVIRAELPDKDKEPKLREAVLKHMSHGPCGALDKSCACMKKLVGHAF
jgi:hypothetical protein